MTYDLVMLIIAVLLGYYIDNYEAYNPCPKYCAIDHEHRIKGD